MLTWEGSITSLEVSDSTSSMPSQEKSQVDYDVHQYYSAEFRPQNGNGSPHKADEERPRFNSPSSPSSDSGSSSSFRHKFPSSESSENVSSKTVEDKAVSTLTEQLYDIYREPHELLKFPPPPEEETLEEGEESLEKREESLEEKEESLKEREEFLKKRKKSLEERKEFLEEEREEFLEKGEDFLKEGEGRDRDRTANNETVEEAVAACAEKVDLASESESIENESSRRARAEQLGIYLSPQPDTVDSPDLRLEDSNDSSAPNKPMDIINSKRQSWSPARRKQMENYPTPEPDTVDSRGTSASNSAMNNIDDYSVESISKSKSSKRESSSVARANSFKVYATPPSESLFLDTTERSGDESSPERVQDSSDDRSSPVVFGESSDSSHASSQTSVSDHASESDFRQGLSEESGSSEEDDRLSGISVEIPECELLELKFTQFGNRRLSDPMELIWGGSDSTYHPESESEGVEEDESSFEVYPDSGLSDW